jgi:hypothetical protein
MKPGPFRLGDRGTGLERFARRCWRKVRHESLGAALAQLRSAKKREETLRDGTTLDAYECQYCQGFHIGHSRDRERDDVE